MLQKPIYTLLIMLAMVCMGTAPTWAQDDEATTVAVTLSDGSAVEVDPGSLGSTATIGDLVVGLDTLWVLIAGFLVFFMNTGFGCLESGFCRAKNTVNILGKNFVVFGLASIAFYIVGFSFMFGDGNPFIGTSGFLLTGADNSPAIDDYEGVYSAISWAGVPLAAKFFFQLAFAATAATIVSGCVAERIHYGAFMIFAFILVAVFYPITGHWIWGGGWLSGYGMWDFAGSTVVHSVGGWAGLAGIIVLGARKGKYPETGGIRPIPGHNMGLVFLGGMILWLGWFGFNPGSWMGVGDGAAISHIVVTTNMACAAGLISATVLSWLWLGSPDFSMTVNGCLAGLVAITAPCAFVTIPASILIGALGGLLVVVAVVVIDRVKIDDPVGALSVHLVNGIWGTLAVGLFATEAIPSGVEGVNGLFYGGGFGLFVAQLVGVLAVGAFTFVGSLAVWFVINAAMGVRVEPEVEARGLDMTEMGMEAYPDDPFPA